MNPYNPYTQHTAYAPERVDHSAFFRKVYAYMAGGLFATGVTATVVASSETLVNMILGNRIVFYGLMIAELVMVLAFSKVVSKLSTPAAAAFFFAYAVLNGLTLSIIFMVYTASSIASTSAACRISKVVIVPRRGSAGRPAITPVVQGLGTAPGHR